MPIPRLFSKSPRLSRAHFLHIGKTGGTAVKYVLKDHPATGRYSIVLHNHKTRLSDIPEREKVFFFLRDPVSRFISGFNSRKRKGQPRYYYEWNDTERRVYETFGSANQLALALGDPDSGNHHLAVLAMKTVKHLGHFSYWYTDSCYFDSRRDDVLFVGFQESMNADFEGLKKSLGLPDRLALPTDDIDRHKSPDCLDTGLDDNAVKVIRDWYRDDYEFVRICEELMRERCKALE